MQTLRILVFAATLSQVPVSFALAQADETGTGGGPLSTEKAPNTTGVGQTKPPSRDASPTSVKSVEHLAPREAADDAISEQICVGCNSELKSTGTSANGGRSSGALRVPDQRLEALHSAPTAKPQGDLDTVALASAHREQSKSTDEKTNGLWQSWLVSVCAGCGDQKPAKEVASDAMPYRDRPVTTGSVETKSTSERHLLLGTRHATTGHRRSVVEDLSTENIDSIRRTPQK